MKTRILFLDHVGVMGGAEWSLLDIARSFRARCTVILFEEGPFREHLEAAGVEVRVLQASSSLLDVSRGSGKTDALRSLSAVLSQAYRIARQARGYDVLYANSQKAFVVGALAAAWARKPFIWHLRNVLSEDGFSRFSRLVVIGLANRLARRVIATSQAVADAFIAHGGRAAKVRVVYNGIDSAPYAAVDPQAVGAIRRELGLEAVPVVGSISRLAPIKGQHVLLEALPALPGVHALLVGEALFGNEAEYAASLRRQALELGLAERVHFLGFRTDLPVLLQVCDVVVMPSVVPEAFGRVAVEGMLAGRPVIATRLGGALELIEDGITGRLVPPEDAAALAGALQALLAKPAEAHRMARTGRQAALQRFALPQMLAALEQQIDEVVSGPQLS